MASNKGWQEAILIVRHTEGVTLLSVEYMFCIIVIYRNGGE
ncbi:hypothetical protein [Bacillus wiedmannii]